MTTRYAILLDSQKGGCGPGQYCATFVAETFAECRALDGETHDGETEPLARKDWQVAERSPIEMFDMAGTPDPGVIARLVSL